MPKSDNMKKHTEYIEIIGRLPGTNEIITAAKKVGNGSVYTRMKRKFTSELAYRFRNGLDGVYELISLKLIWNEKKRYRDPDNVMGGIKFILDGLVQAGIIPDDNYKHIGAIEQEVKYGEKDSIMVIITGEKLLN